jgi:hypothetical protein
MSNSEHVERFAGLPVRDYDPEEGLVDPSGSAQRLRVEDDGAVSAVALLERLLDDPAAGQVVALVIGPWVDSQLLCEGEGSGPIVAALAGARERLPGLRALFLGDVTYDECEISWLNQSNIIPLLEAYPNLERLRVRGANELGFWRTRHEALKELVFESGGLPSWLVLHVLSSDLPNLEHLELWLGSADYGGDTTHEDLAPLLSGAVFPRLKYLGLRNCEFADALASALARSPILKRIEVLDLSLGNLGDEGALALLSGGQLAGLKKLDIHHHYVSDEVLDGLKDLGIELDAAAKQKPGLYATDDVDEDRRYIAVAE